MVKQQEKTYSTTNRKQNECRQFFPEENMQEYIDDAIG